MTIEKAGVYKSYNYLVVARDSGYRCGYVQIPESHRLYGNDSLVYDTAFNVHGDITYSGQDEFPGYPGYWIGFDCAHYGDAKDPAIMSPRDRETHRQSLFRNGTIRNTEYVDLQCRSLIDQVISYSILSPDLTR